MRCSRCRREAVHFQRYSGLGLCEGHLRDDVEARARKEIRAEGGIRPGDRIAVALSGNPESLALAHFLRRTFAGRRDLSLLALTVDRGSGGCPGQVAAETAARSPGLERVAVPQGEDAGSPAVGASRNNEGVGGCTVSTAQKQDKWEDAAHRAGATVLATGDCLDDVAGQVLGRVLRGEVPGRNRQVMPGLRTLTPFRRIPGDEIRRYAEGIGATGGESSCRSVGDGPEDLAASLLAAHASRHPSAPHALLRLWDSLEGMEVGPLPRDRAAPGREEVRGDGQDAVHPGISPMGDTGNLRKRIHLI
jgi:tRNA(Ile)-lysidine synthase TilS/MesJ